MLSAFFRHHRTIVMTTAVLFSVAGITLATLERSSRTESIPLPFAQQSGNLQGALTFFEKRNAIDVYQVTFTAGETSETFAENTIYLVHTPSNVTSLSMDDAFTLLSGQRAVHYFGYEYMDSTASVERAHIRDTLFRDRFPGKFFASHKARLEDGTHGNTLSAFESRNNVTFLATDTGALSPRLRADWLYVFVVNEPLRAQFFPGGVAALCGNGTREGSEQCDDGNTVNTDTCTTTCTLSGTQNAICGNGIKEGAEECDDGDTNPLNTCRNDCTLTFPIPFDSLGSTSSSSSFPSSTSSSLAALALPSLCGNGVQDPTETCDQGNGNTVAGDGCSSVCAIEPDFRCTNFPSVCVPYIDLVRSLSDANGDGTVSELEAFTTLLDVTDIDLPSSLHQEFDITGDGVVASEDSSIILRFLDILSPSS